MRLARPFLNRNGVLYPPVEVPGDTSFLYTDKLCELAPFEESELGKATDLRIGQTLALGMPASFLTGKISGSDGTRLVTGRRGGPLDPVSNTPQIITAVATSVVALGVVTQAIVWGVRRWRRRVSWRSLSQDERDVVWGIGVSCVSTFRVDYDEAHTTSDKPLAFLREGRLSSDEPLVDSVLHLHPIYVIHLESMQDKDLVRPYSNVLLELSPSTYSARPRLQELLQSNQTRIRKHEARAGDKINFAD